MGKVDEITVFSFQNMTFFWCVKTFEIFFASSVSEFLKLYALREYI